MFHRPNRSRRLVSAAVAAISLAAIIPVQAATTPASLADGGELDHTPLTSADRGGLPAPFDADLTAQLATASPDDTLGVFVHGDSIDDSIAAIVAVGTPLGAMFERVGVAVTYATPAQIAQLADAPGVAYLEGDTALDFSLDTSHEATRGNDARTAFTTELGGDGDIDGSGVTVAVVDTGVDGTHPFFARADGTSKVVRNLRVVQGQIFSGGIADELPVLNFVEDVPGNNSDQPGSGGHGTHVSGIAVGVDVSDDDSGLGVPLNGAAPGADLVGLAIGSGATLIGANIALEWVLENHDDPCGDDSCDPIKVVNNSYGAISAGAEYDPDGATAKIQNALVADGVVMVWAAGNGDELNDGGDGSDVRTNDDGQSPTPGVISVANYDDGGSGTRNGALAGSSSRGEASKVRTYPDLSAPGTAITSSCRVFLDCTPETDNPDYGTISGTSMAAPHVAGIVAQLFEADPSLTPALVEDILEDTAYKFSFGAAYRADLAERNDDNTTSFDKGHGLVDVKAALAQIAGVTLEGEEAPPTCDLDSPIAIDEAGDSENAVTDLLGARAEQTEDGIVFTFEVNSDDSESYPEGVTGLFYDLDMNVGPANIFIAANRSLIDNVPPELDSEEFVIGRNRTTLETLDSALEGSFDGGTITITLTQDDIDRANIAITEGNAEPGATVEPLIPALDTDPGIGNFLLSARESTWVVAGNLLSNADTAAGTCGFLVGTGVVPASALPGAGGDDGGDDAPFDPPAADEYDSEVSSTTTAEWSGEAAMPAYQVNTVFDGCLGPDDPYCVNHTLYVSESGVLTVNVDFPALDDWDIYLYDAEGDVVASAATADPSETLTFLDARPGLYTVAALPYLTPSGTFDATATIG